MTGALLFPYCLPLRRPWVAASATLTERHGALLRLVDADGLEGWGDCAPLPSGGPPGRVLAALEVWASCVAPDYPPGNGLDDGFGNGPGDGMGAHPFLSHPGVAALPPEARWAVETALADLAAQRAGLPLARFLNPLAPLDIAVNAALGPLDDGCTERAMAAIGQGFDIGKLKVGLAPVEVELERLRRLVNATEGRIGLRLDANRAWSEGDAKRFLQALVDLPVEAVEEPLAAPTLAGLAELQRRLPYAIAIDESLPAFGIDAIATSQAVRRLVLKPARLGGIAATCAAARIAQAAGMDLVLTSVVDSAVGVAAAAHLAAALSPHLAHGLGTSTWLAADVAPSLPVIRGRAKLASGGRSLLFSGLP